MVTNHHEIGHTLFDEDPDLIVRALDRCGVPFPRLKEVTPLGTGLSRAERRAERVFRFRTVEGDEGIFVLESWLTADYDKPKAWGYYGMSLTYRYNVPVTIIAVTSNPRCEEQAREGFEFGHGFGDSLHVRPLVLGPGNVEMVTDDDAADADVFSIALCAAVHRDGGDISALLEAAAKAIRDLPEPVRPAVADNIELMLGATGARELWRRLMPLHPHLARDPSKLGPVFRALSNAFIEEALSAARAKGLAELLLEKLAWRSISISDEQRDLVITCADEKLLETWFIRAVHATKAAHVFTD